MNKNGKNSELFCILGCLNLHWQTSFGRNQQKPRQMKKHENKWTKNEKHLEFFLHFWRFEPSLANLIWTKPAKTEANEKNTKERSRKKRTNMKTKMKKQENTMEKKWKPKWKKWTPKWTTNLQHENTWTWKWKKNDAGNENQNEKHWKTNSSTFPVSSFPGIS